MLAPQVEKRLVIAGSDPATARNTPAAPGRSEDREELYCLCQRPFDPQMAQSGERGGPTAVVQTGEWLGTRRCAPALRPRAVHAA